MNLDEILQPVETINVGDAEGNNQKSATFIDMDTILDVAKNRYRLRDINAGEVWSTYSGVAAPAEVGAQELTTQAAILANHFGFNRIQKTGQSDRNREVIDLVNNSGQNLSDYAVEERLVGANRNTSKEVLTNRMLNRFMDEVRLATDPAEAGNRSRSIINEAIREADIAPTWAREAVDEEQYAMAKMLYGHNEIAGMAKALEEETDPVKKQRIQDALYEAKSSSNPFVSVENRQNDRSIDNVAYGQFSTSLYLGLENTVQSLYGIADLAGDTSGWDWLEKKGEAGIARSEYDASLEGSVLTSYNEIEDAGDAFTWLTNNVAMSIPFMAAAVGGGLLTAPLGGAAVLGTAGALAVGALPSTILTTGSVWNSMPEGEKSAPIAIAAGFAVGLLDRFGFTGMPKAIAAGAAVERGSMKDLFTEIQAEVVEALVKEGKFTPAAAWTQVQIASRSQIIKMGDDFQKMASDKLRDLKMVKDVVRKIAGATTREATTEVVQTAIEEVAAVAGNSAELDPARFKEALITSAVVGGVFGSTFAMPSVAKQYSDRAAILHDVANSTQVASDLDEFSREDQEQATAEGKVTRTNEDNLEDIRKFGQEVPVAGSDSHKQDKSFDDRNKAGSTQRSAEGAFKRAFNAAITRPGGLFKAHFLNMVEKIGLRDADGNRRTLLSRFSSLYSETGINSGESHQEYIQNLRGTLTSILPNAERVAQALGTNLRGANRIIKLAVEAAANGTEYTGPKADVVKEILAIYEAKQIALKAEFMKLGLVEEADALKGKYDILTNRPLDQKRISKDRTGFKRALEGLGMGPAIADAYIARLLSSDATAAAMELNTLYDTSGGTLSPYMNQNVLTSYKDGLSTTAKYAGDRKYLGKDNYLLTNALNKMVRIGEITEKEANELAADLNDYLEIANGEYGAWKSPWIKSVQDNLILMTFLRGMGFSALASWPEVPLTQLGVPQHIAFKHMSDHAKDGVHSFAEYINYMVSLPPGSPIPRKIYSKSETEKKLAGGKLGQDILGELGYKGAEGSAVRQQGIEISSWQQTIANHYAKAVGLNNITDYTRGIRASMAADVISYYADVLASDPDAVTNMGREAYSELRELGVNVEFMKNLHNRWKAEPDRGFIDEAEMAMFNQNLEIGTLRFVDQAIVNPLPGRVPKGYKHQKLAIFNQFQGFIANFTARVLPKILKNVTSGSPGVTTNALVTALTMMAAAMFATMLRDEIKYGETTPYLDDWDKFRRVVFASGLLGTGERVLSGISPLYGSRSSLPQGNNPVTQSLSRSIEGALGEAAAYGTVKDIAGSAYEFGFGDNRKGAKQAIKLLPIIGSVNQSHKSILDFF